MKIDTLFRHTREAFRSLTRNTWMTFAASSAVAVTLLIFGFFLVFAFNISYMATELDKQVAVRAFFQPNVTDDDIDQVIAQIKKDPAVAKVKFVSKEDGLRQMKENWGDDESFFRGLEKGNPLPDGLVIQAKDPQKTKALSDSLDKYSQISDKSYGEGVTNNILGISEWVRNAVFIFGLGLAILAAFLISNTIKLTIFARRREIEIMRLVGASNWFIRWPFFIEGSIIGVLGAIIPTAVTLVSYNAVLGILNADGAYSLFKLLPMWPLSMYVAGITTILGILIGVWGSMISVRRFLKV
ncbi:permease-like cell division protein FtsX [Marininema halotolerans]|uniref:Cell division protein FtsX n=1 Tax=Marininema halotolerans TaxID=1155944 RepID=A0A1I6NYK8_9BACL|nr:permease-like cell division protein FtsX [Marininema halotolerans]SFS33011.1 cell division transport system permease protein [Marininema halotolerans]